MARKYNLHCVEAGLNQGLDARLDARRRRIRRGKLHARLLFVRRSDCRPRLSHDGISRSIGETLGCLKQNDIVLGRTWLLSEQNSLGRGLCSWASTHRRDVHARSRTRARLHKAGHLENSNGLSRHYRLTTFDIFEKRGGSQHLPKNKHQQIWNKTK